MFVYIYIVYVCVCVCVCVYTSLCEYCCSVAKMCLTLSNPMKCSMLGFPVLPYLLEFAQIHVH